MKTMRRFVAGTAVCICALIFCAAAILWVRVFFGLDEVTLMHEQTMGTVVEQSEWRFEGAEAGATLAGGGGFYLRVFRTQMWPTVNRQEGIWTPPRNGWFLEFNEMEFKHGKRITDAIRKEGGWAFAGFGFLHEQLADALGPKGTVEIMLPYWFMMFATGTYAAWAVRKTVLRRRARRNGLCSKCGYDLRASKDRCPECGTPINPKPPITLR